MVQVSIGTSPVITHRQQELTFLRQCEADAVERGHACQITADQDLHFAYAAVFAARITALTVNWPVDQTGFRFR